MIEGLWSVEFETNVGFASAGVIVFETQRAFGGDGGYYYVGDYNINDHIVTAKIKSTHYAGEPGDVFGSTVKERTLLLSGKVTNPMVIMGCDETNPKLQVRVKLTKRSELP